MLEISIQSVKDYILFRSLVNICRLVCLNFTVFIDYPDLLVSSQQIHGVLKVIHDSLYFEFLFFSYTGIEEILYVASLLRISYIVLADLDFLRQLPKCWDYKLASPDPTLLLFNARQQSSALL